MNLYKTLSIYIPTWNRSNYLDQLLETLVKSAIGFEENIEIVISDNASDDDTFLVVEKYRLNYSYIRYHRNKENIWEGNYRQAPELCDGSYLWIIGDDDQVGENAICEVLSAIKEGPMTIVIDYTVYSRDFKNCLTKPIYGIKEKINITDFNVALNTFGVGAGFLSCVVYKKEIYHASNAVNTSKLRNVGFYPMFLAYFAISKSSSIIAIPSGHLMRRGNNERFVRKESQINNEEMIETFILGSCLMWKELINLGYDPEVVEKVKDRYFKSTLLKIIVNAIKNGFDIQLIHGFAKGCYSNLFIYRLILISSPFVHKIILVWGYRLLTCLVILINNFGLAFRKIFSS